MNQTFHNRSGTDTKVIATLTAISQVSARMAKNLRIIAAHRQAEEGGTVNAKNKRCIYDHLTEFDESLVRRWVKQITIWDDHITVELKSGVSIDVDA